MEATTGGRRPGWFARKLRHFRAWHRAGGEVLRREGPTRLLARAAVVVGGTVYHYSVFVALDLLRPLPEITTDVPVRIRLLRPEDVDAYAEFRAEATGTTRPLRRLEQGDVCVAAWLEDEIVSAAWFAFGTIPLGEIGQRLGLAHDEVYVSDTYTTERLRGRSVTTVRALWAAAYLRDSGYRRAIGCISPQNRPAFGPARKAGFVRLGIAGFFRVGPWRRDFVQPVGERRRWTRRGEPIVVERDFALASSEDRAPAELRNDQPNPSGERRFASPPN